MRSSVCADWLLQSDEVEYPTQISPALVSLYKFGIIAAHATSDKCGIDTSPVYDRLSANVGCQRQELANMANSYDDMVRFYEMEHEAFLEDLALYRGFAQRCGGPLLELGCGTGRLLIPLAQMGFEVVGVDCSAPMLTCARRKIAPLAPQMASRITLIQGDMRYISLRRKFPLIFIALNTFVHLVTAEDQRRVLSIAARHLSSEGRLIIDLGNPTLLPTSGEPLILHRRWRDDETGETVIKFMSTHFDPASQLEEVVLIYDVIDRQGRVVRSVYPFTIHHTYRREMELLLEQTGLRIEVCYGSYDLDPYDTQSERMIFVACHVGK